MLKYLKHLFSLFYPNVCMACSNALLAGEQHICINCLITLPKTHFHVDDDNPVARSFWGRAPVKSAAAYYYFKKGTGVQNLLHNLKYKGQKDMGVSLGLAYGAELKQSANFNSVAVIIPVPLHKKKLRQRGYNQSEYFAKGLAQGMGAVLDTASLIKSVHTQSQTKKSRIERVKNVEDVFTVTNTQQLAGKHVLLVDDVITTGATIEACALKLAEVDNITISVVSIAYAN
jgi:ComF family protein